MTIETAKAALASDLANGLRLLLEAQASAAILAAVFPQVIGGALDSSNGSTIATAREVLRLHAGEPWVKRRLQEEAATYLPAQDEWNYRRLVELYEVLGYREELAALLVLCRSSSSAEIQELADDFGHSATKE